LQHFFFVIWHGGWSVCCIIESNIISVGLLVATVWRQHYNNDRLLTLEKAEMEKLIISIVAILGTLIALKFKGLFHRLISIGLAISVLLVWTGDKYIITGSFIALTILTIATIIYGLTVNNLNGFEKISITTMGIFLSVSSIFKILHWSGAELIKLSLTVPIIITIIAFIKVRQLTREMSFMIFWLVYSTLEILKLWLY